MFLVCRFVVSCGERIWNLRFVCEADFERTAVRVTLYRTPEDSVNNGEADSAVLSSSLVSSAFSDICMPFKAGTELATAQIPKP